jgi:hypothetical protein
MTKSTNWGRTALIGFVVVALGANAILVSRYLDYQRETTRLREGMTKAQRERADAVVAAERHRIRIELELIRRQARGDRQLHLAVNVDSNRMVLERDGVVLREMNVRIGQERIPGARGDSTIIQVSALGRRTVERRLSANDEWEVPPTTYQDRGLPLPDDRSVRGALGANAIILNEGTVVYAVPEKGPLADSTYVLPGSVQVSEADLKALSASIRPGMAVYFYRSDH